MDINALRKSKKQEIKSISTKKEYQEYISKFKLDDEQRKIADMVFVNGWDYNLIGSHIGLSESAVKKRVRKILDLL